MGDCHSAVSEGESEAVDGDCGREPGRLPDHEGKADDVSVELGHFGGVAAQDGGETD